MNALWVTPDVEKSVSHSIIKMLSLYGIRYNTTDTILIKKCRSWPNLVDKHISVRLWNEIISEEVN